MVGSGHGRQVLDPVVVLDAVLMMDLDRSSEIELPIRETDEMRTAGLPAAKVCFNDEPVFHDAPIAGERVFRSPEKNVTVRVADSSLEIRGTLSVLRVHLPELRRSHLRPADRSHLASGRVMATNEPLPGSSKFATPALAWFTWRLRLSDSPCRIVAVKEAWRRRIMLRLESYRITASAFTEMLALLFGDPGRARSPRGQNAPALCHRAILSERGVCR